MRVVDVFAIGQHRHVFDLEPVGDILVGAVLAFEFAAELCVARGVRNRKTAQDRIDRRIRGFVVAHAAHDAHGFARMGLARHDLEGGPRRALSGHLGQRSQALARRRQGFAFDQRGLFKHDMRGIEIRRGQPDHAIGTDFAGVRIDEVVELAVDGIAAQHELEQRCGRFDQLQARIVVDPAQIEFAGFRAAEFEPVEYALAGLDTIEPALDRAESRLAELGQRGTEIGRGQHHQMAHRTFGQALGLQIGPVEPVADHRAAGRVRDADESPPGTRFGKHAGQRGLEAARNIRQPDLVAKADVLA